jgi:hypothetical protein
MFNNSQDTNNRIVYLLNGTYGVQNTIDFLRFMVLQGQSRDGTRIKLLDHCIGYDDHVVNNGGKVWIFGMKAENPSTDAVAP